MIFETETHPNNKIHAQTNTATKVANLCEHTECNCSLKSSQLFQSPIHVKWGIANWLIANWWNFPGNDAPDIVHTIKTRLTITYGVFNYGI